MIKTRKEKEMFVSYLSERLKNTNSFVLVDYRGLKVNEIDDLRRNLKKAEGEYKVVKNTLTKLALSNLHIDNLITYLEGPTALVMPLPDLFKEKENIVDLSKVLVNFAKLHKNLKIKAGLLNGKLIETSEIEELSNLPNREVLLCQLIGELQGSMRGLVNTLSKLIGKLVYSLNAIIEKKRKE